VSALATCSRCEAVLAPDAVACPLCGQAREADAVRACPACGLHAAEDETSCRRCRAPLAGVEPRPPARHRDRWLRAAARPEDVARYRVLRTVGQALAVAGAAWLVLVAPALVGELEGSAYGLLLVPIVAGPLVLGAAIAAAPRSTIAVAAWLGALGTAAFILTSGVVPSALGTWAHPAASVLLVASLVAIDRPERQALVRTTLVAAFVVGAHVWLEAEPHWGTLDALDPRSLRLFAFGCVACFAVFLAIERVSAHRRALGAVVLVALGFAYAALAFELGPTAAGAAGFACELFVMAVAAAALVDAPGADRAPGETP